MRFITFKSFGLVPIAQRFFLGFVLAFIANVSVLRGEITLPAQRTPIRLVNDLAGILSPGFVYALEQNLRQFEDSTSNQITVVIVSSLNDYSAIEYAYKIGDTWGVGQKGKDNGVVFLIAPSERKMAIAPGRGLTGALPDIICKRIISNTAAPRFKLNDYEGGIEAAVYELQKRIKNEFDADQAPEVNPAIILLIIIIIFFVLFFVLFSISKHSRSFTTINQRGWRDQYPTNSQGPGGWWFPTGGGGGDNDSGGSSWGGFGGGGFDGGGAGGSW